MTMGSLMQKFKNQRRGITLLLMVVLLAAFLSISIGIVNALPGQVILVGQSGDSFVALYAADMGIERALYRDRVQHLCVNPGACNESRALPGNACFDTVVNIPATGCSGGSTRCITVAAKNMCGGVERYVERKFSISY